MSKPLKRKSLEEILYKLANDIRDDYDDWLDNKSKPKENIIIPQAKADILKLLLTEGEIKKIAKSIPSTAEINGIQMINFKLLSQALHNAQKKKIGG